MESMGIACVNDATEMLPVSTSSKPRPDSLGWVVTREQSENLPKAQIAARLGISRETVAAEGPPVFRRDVVPSSFDGVESQVRARLLQTPSMPLTVIGERVGWRYSSFSSSHADHNVHKHHT